MQPIDYIAPEKEMAIWASLDKHFKTISKLYDCTHCDQKDKCMEGEYCLQYRDNGEKRTAKDKEKILKKIIKRRKENEQRNYDGRESAKIQRYS